MTPAPYNPDTLALMRKNARFGLLPLAQMLGWSEQRTAEVARKHYIELGPAASEFMPSPSIAPLLDPIDEMAPTPRANVIKLSGRKAEIFELLRCVTSWMPGSELTAALNIDARCLGSSVSQLRSKLIRVGVKLESKMGRVGGYRVLPRNDGTFPTLSPSREFVLPSLPDGDSSPNNPRSSRYPQAPL